LKQTGLQGNSIQAQQQRNQAKIDVAKKIYSLHQTQFSQRIHLGF